MNKNAYTPSVISRRQVLKGLSMLPFLASGSKHLLAGPADGHGVGIQRLNWAGMRFVSGDRTLLIDPVVTDIWGGNSPYPMVGLEANTEGRTYALITHAHGDHFDVPGLKKLLGEKDYVICEAKLAPYIISRGLKVLPLEPFHPGQRGPFTYLPLPAVDGTGDDQVSWVISVEGKKYLHGGDSVWHGRWRTWAAAYGPFEAVFLPINGAVQADQPASETPLSLTPKEAVDAAVLLGAKQVVPIHYGHHVEGQYEEYPDALNHFRAEAERRQVKATVLKPGEWLPT